MRAPAQPPEQPPSRPHQVLTLGYPVGALKRGSPRRLRCQFLKREVSFLFISHRRPLGPFSVLNPGQDGAAPVFSLPSTPRLGLSVSLGASRPVGPCPLDPQVSALRRLAKPMSERVAGRVGPKSPMLDSGAEVSASTTSSEAESGARSVSSIVRQWDRKINHFLGSHPAPTVPGARPAR